MEMNKITNYPNQDDYETEEEFNEAQELYWMEVDRQYDEFKQDKLNELNNLFISDKDKLNE